MVRTAKHTQCRPASRNMIFHHQRSLARQSFHLWPIVQSRRQHAVFYDGGSVHATDVSALAGVKDFPSSFSAYRHISRNVVLHRFKGASSDTFISLKRERELH